MSWVALVAVEERPGFSIRDGLGLLVVGVIVVVVWLGFRRLFDTQEPPRD